MKKGVVISLAIGIAAALGFFAQQQLGGRDAATTSVADGAGPAAATDPGATPGDPSPAGDAAAAPESRIPEVLPQFELADRDGVKRSLAHWKGQPVAVNYWATWCGPCRREIPLLNALRAERKAQRLEIVGIAVDFRDDVLAYAKTTPIDYPMLIGEEDGLAAVQAMGLTPAFPFTVFADSQQRIVALKVGELHREEADLILDKLIAVDTGRLELAQARAEITAGLKEIATRRAAQEAPAAPSGPPAAAPAGPAA